ncbi:hypothetical protein H8356DRAFT_1432705 [Neocallimastix lanati (nom. inval.)]|nr:hypothetical protein H8356DRAFT_1432705 [Neocallimastix sp. JGI-2020a]
MHLFFNLFQSIIPFAIGQQWSLLNRFKSNPITTNSVNAEETVRQASRASATNEDHNFTTNILNTAKTTNTSNARMNDIPVEYDSTFRIIILSSLDEYTERLHTQMGATIKKRLQIFKNNKQNITINTNDENLFTLNRCPIKEIDYNINNIDLKL